MTTDIKSEHLGKIIDIVATHTLSVPSHTKDNYWFTLLTSDTMKHLIAGGVAGAVSRTVVSPMERMKILFQVHKYNTIFFYMYIMLKSHVIFFYIYTFIQIGARSKHASIYRCLVNINSNVERRRF